MEVNNSRSPREKIVSRGKYRNSARSGPESSSGGNTAGASRLTTAATQEIPSKRAVTGAQPSARFRASASINAFKPSSVAFVFDFAAGRSAADFTGSWAKR